MLLRHFTPDNFLDISTDTNYKLTREMLEERYFKEAGSGKISIFVCEGDRWAFIDKDKLKKVIDAVLDLVGA